MQKKCYWLPVCPDRQRSRNPIWRVMRLTVILLTITFMSAHATSMSQQLTLTGKETTLKQAFAAIEAQTGYVVLAYKGVFNSTAPVSLSVTNMPLREVLDTLLKDMPVKYAIIDKTIVLSRKAAAPPPLAWLEAVAVVKPLRVKVTDSAGNPLSGAYVVLKNRSSGGVTDKEGFINLSASENDLLEISFVGHITRTIRITGVTLDKQVLVITLSAALNNLNDIAVTINTGYQQIRPEQRTGAIARIGTREYESRISTDFLSGLVNRMPGLVINNDVKFNTSLNGVQSSNSLFNVRGISTITGNQNPLIVIDGYPTELTLNMINPNEIESVTILKDAAAATIYGVRASNGVIVIERKQAVAGKTRLNFRTAIGIQPEENYSRYRWASNASGINVAYNRDRYKTSVDPSSWSTMLRTSDVRVPVYFVMAQQASAVITPEQAAEKFSAMSQYNNAADYGRLFLRSAVSQTYNMDVSGGNPGALYYITANYSRRNPTQIDNNSDQFMLSGRTSINFSRRLSMVLTTDYLETRNNAVPVPNITTINPYERFQDATGAPVPLFGNSPVNPYYNDILVMSGLLDNMYYPLVDVHEISDKSRTSNNRITADFTYKLFSGFSFRFGGIYESSKTSIRHYATEKSSEARQYVNTYTTQGTSGLVFNIPRGGFLQQQNSNTNSYTLRAQLNYDKHIGKDHAVNGILGAEVRNVVDQLSSAGYFGYNDQTLLQQPANYSQIATGFTSPFVTARTINYSSLFNQQYAENRYVSGFSNIVYTFRRKYSVSGSARLDQSNLFGNDPRYRYKPLWSVGINWNIYKERFMEKLLWVKTLNLRISKGINGNVAKMSLPQVIAKSITNSFTVPVSTALTRFSFANSGLRWEQTNNFNAGLDFSIFRSISGSVDYYAKKSTDLLANAQINPSLGTATYINTASINNQGLELKLQADWITHDRFNWNTGLVVARNTSKVVKVYQDKIFNPASLNGAGYLEGYPLGSVFAYRWAGLDDTGLPQIRDDKGKIYATGAANIAQVMNNNPSAGVVQYMGTSLPTINAGLSNRVDVGNFYFYAMIHYYGGFKVVAPRPDPTQLRPLAGSGSYWKQPGDEMHSDVMSLAGFATQYPGYAYRYSDVNTVNGDYITLGDLTASYNFANAPVFRKAGITRFEVKLQASNIYTIGLNKFNFSQATGNYAKSYLTPTYTIGLFTNF